MSNEAGSQIFTFLSSVPGALRFSCVVRYAFRRKYFLIFFKILNFCGGVSMAASWARHWSAGSFFNFVAWTGLILSLASFIIHALKIYQ